jgi:ribosome-binding factor A
MDSKRQQKFARLIQKDLGDLFQRDARPQLDGAFVTVTEVKVTPDLGIARVYLSFLLVNDKQAMLEQIRDKTKYLRQLLGNRIRHQVRVVPELQFYLDDSADYAAKMDALFSGLTIPPAPAENEDKE